MSPQVGRTSFILKQPSNTKQQKPTLREVALQTNKTNPSQLGDPVSLKAEKADSEPTNQDRGASSTSSSSSKTSAVKENLSKVAPAPTEGDGDKKGAQGESNPGNAGGHQTLRQKALKTMEQNPSQLGDPVSLKAEKADSEPTDQDRGAAATKRAEKSSKL